MCGFDEKFRGSRQCLRRLSCKRDLQLMKSWHVKYKLVNCNQAGPKSDYFAVFVATSNNTARTNC